MSKSEWKVTSNIIGGEKKYGVYRLKDKDAVDHSGNREELGRWFDERELAQAYADAMNESEEANNG